MTRLSRRTLLGTSAAAAAGLARPSRARVAEPLRIAFVYNSPVGDAGWTFQHDQGRRAVEAALGGRVRTAFVESVTEQDAERVIRGFARGGHRLVFATSFGFMNPMVRVAAEFPDVAFEHATGYKTSPNLGVYHARDYEARYLSGVAAGKVSRTGAAGFVASFPIPEVVRSVNAFTLGMRSVRPDAQVRVLWVSTWFDPGKEREAAEALVIQGCDVVSQFTDSSAPTLLAQEKGVWSISVGSDRSRMGPDAHLTSVVYEWGGFYAETARRVLDGTWKPENVWGGLGRGMIAIAPLNPKVPDDARALVEAKRAAIAGGTLHPFAGPVRDQQGTVRVAPGGVADDPALLSMDYYVEGVVGSLPG